MSARIRSLCCIDCSLTPVFERRGIRVHRLAPPEGIASLPELLASLPETPDAIIQQEHLGKRVVLTGLDQAPCPTLYWALDPHLNRFWQRHYSRLFAATACTQKHLCPSLGPVGRPAAWITWHGQSRPFVPHAVRTVDLGFLGRITSQRQRRSWFAAHLVRHGLVTATDRFGPELHAFYDTVRIAPNECIAGEINMRLFEAASCGCLPVAEKTPEGVAELFEPEREAVYYDDVLELDDRIRFALAHPGLTEKMALAAHAAVATRHLPEHRAQALLDLLAAAGPTPEGDDAAAALAMTLFLLWRARQLELSPKTIRDHLQAAPPRPDILAAQLQLALCVGNRDRALALATLCPADGALAGDATLAAACCLAAFRLGDAETARHAYVAHARSRGRTRLARLDDHYAYLLYFAGALEREGHLAAPGQPFDTARDLPENAVQCLFAAASLRPEAPEPKRRLEILLRGLPGTETERIGLLSHLGLHAPDDWAIGLQLALTNARAFRLEATIEEGLLAAQTAARLGETPRFTRRLALLDPSGRLGRALAH